MVPWRERLLGSWQSLPGDAYVGERTWAALAGAAGGWAQRLQAAGVRTGDRVAALSEARVEVVEAMLGAYAIGAIWVPINPRYQSAEIEHVVHDCAARCVVVEDALAERLPAGVPQLGIATPVDPQPLTIAAMDDAAAALLIYTSGTTGRSKGVELSYRAVGSGIAALTELWQWSSADRLSLMLPLFHVHGLCIGVHGALLHGMSTVLHPRFDPAALVADVQHGATVFMGVPTMYVRLLQHLSQRPEDGAVLSRARLFTAGSAALPAADLHAFQRATGHRIVERYGMSESLITLSNPYDGERRAGSVGLPVPGVSMRVVDDEGRVVADGEPGELQVCAPGMMTGYWGRPDATAEAFDGPWLRTGDVAVRQADGYVQIVGRKSVDVIKSGGFKIGAREIEEVLARHPAVREVAVFGQPDPEWGERIVAAVVLGPDGPREPDALLAELQGFCRSALADYKKPRAVIVLPELPRNAMGKVQKVALQRYAPPH